MSHNLPYRMRVPMVAGDDTGPQWSQRFLAAHNAERIARGLPPLAGSPRLDEVAQLRVDDIVAEGYFGHDDPHDAPDRIDGKYHQIMAQLGINGWQWAGENLAMNNAADPLPRAMTQLMNSPTHRANILDPEYTHMGAAARVDNERRYWFACIYTSGGDV
jgi:uncharacterized protein YkwD